VAGRGELPGGGFHIAQKPLGGIEFTKMGVGHPQCGGGGLHQKPVVAEPTEVAAQGADHIRPALRAIEHRCAHPSGQPGGGRLSQGVLGFLIIRWAAHGQHARQDHGEHTSVVDGLLEGHHAHPDVDFRHEGAGADAQSHDLPVHVLSRRPCPVDGRRFTVPAQHPTQPRITHLRVGLAGGGEVPQRLSGVGFTAAEQPQGGRAGVEEFPRLTHCAYLAASARSIAAYSSGVGNFCTPR